MVRLAPFRVIAEGAKDEVVNIKDEETYKKIRNIAIEHHNYTEESGDILSL